MNLVKPELSEVLSIILPTREQTWLLRSCFLPGAPGRQAWEMFLKNVSDPLNFLTQNSQGTKAFMPILFNSLMKNTVEIEPQLLTVFRTAHAHEEFRTKYVRRICHDILSAFQSEKGSVVVLKGAVLAETVYQGRGFRHCHDLDILTKDFDPKSVARRLSSIGFRPPRPHALSADHTITFHHESGFPLSLHRDLFSIPFFNGDVRDVWSRTRNQTIAGARASVLSPADNLLHACGLVFCRGQRQSIYWVSDSWLIIDQNPDLDWDLVYHCAQRQCLTYPLSVVLGYLAEELTAPIPDRFLHRLFSAASGSKRIEHEVSLFGARASARGGFTRIIRRANSWRTKGSILQWMVLPSPQYVRWVEPCPRSWLLPFYYVYRPLRYITQRLFACLKNARQVRKLQTGRITLGLSTRP